MFQRRFKNRRGSGNSASATSSSTATSYKRTINDDKNNSNGGGGALANFDACIEACDALAASSSIQKFHNHSDGRNKNEEDEDHVSTRTGTKSMMMISPDGELLSCCNVNTTNDSSTNMSSPTNKILQGVNEEEEADRNNNKGQETNSFTYINNDVDNDPQLSFHSNITSIDDEIESSICIGNDEVIDGEKVLNGFSARGWNPIMTTMAIRRAIDTLKTTTKFVEEIVLNHKNSAAHASQACEELRGMMIMNELSNLHINHHRNGSDNRINDNNNDHNRHSNDDQKKSSAGPLLFPSSSLYNALVAIEQYNSKIAEQDARRWRMTSTTYQNTATNNHNPSNGSLEEGLLTSIQNRTRKNYIRAERREKALMDSHEQLAEAESNLRARKETSKKLWANVNLIEEEVNKKVEEKLRQRSRDREMKRRQEEFERQAVFLDGQLNSMVTQQEIWDLVSQVGADNDGSFAPHDLPPPNVIGPIDQTLSKSKSFDSPVKTSQHETPPPSPIDDYRATLEEEYRLHELRVAAVESDENVADAAGKLLNAISACDTTKRSARIAAETCLLSCANSQAKCLKSLVALEKASLLERLKVVNELEEKIDKIDVRKDLNAFIEHEKNEVPNGRSSLGDNDDGGVASALATLNSFSEGIGVGVGVAGMAELSSFSGWNENSSEEVFERDDIEDAVGVLFNSEASMKVDTDNLDGEQNETELEKSIKFLERAIGEKSIRGRGYRASTCYALNNHRGKNTQLFSKIQYDGLCRVLNALLNGCDREAADVANAKMVMMLAQTFYFMENNDGTDDRTNRKYPKEKLCNNSIWSDEDFWTQALFQCVTDSLANSGVMVRVRVKKSDMNKKMKWHDLNFKDRSDAAAQIHSVIFSQLGALSHSMVEFGCSVEQACAFVRRLSVRHQLPLSQRSMLLSHLMNGKNE